MNETKYSITITNLDEAQKKADELLRSLQQAKQLIRDISESPLNVELFEDEKNSPRPYCGKFSEIEIHY